MKTSATLQTTSSSYKPIKMKSRQYVYSEIYNRKDKARSYHLFKAVILRVKQQAKNSKLVPEPHSWPTSSSLLGAFFRPQTTFFNTISVVQVYLKSTKWIEIKSSWSGGKERGFKVRRLGCESRLCSSGATWPWATI